MKMFDFLKGSLLLQELVMKMIMVVPAPVHHNIEKLHAIRKAFAFTGQEGVKGDYLEFGVFQGNSLIAAINAFKYQNDCYGGNNKVDKCRFIGCDSFEGLVTNPEYDSEHPLYSDQKQLKTSYDLVIKRLKKYRKKYEIHIIKGFYSDTLSSSEFKNLNIEKLRVVFYDCDLKSSTIDALKYSAPFWQEGSVLIFDDMFSYKGNSGEGECGAFSEFCDRHPEFSYRNFGYYGFDGMLLIVDNPPDIEKNVNQVVLNT